MRLVGWFYGMWNVVIKRGREMDKPSGKIEIDSKIDKASKVDGDIDRDRQIL